MCDVTPFSAEYKPTADIPIVSGATAYTDPKTGVTMILIINKALWFGNCMTHLLINPNQYGHLELIYVMTLLTHIVLCA